MQVASVKAVAEAAGREALQSPEAFMRGLAEVERGPDYTSERGVVEMPVLWRFGKEVSSCIRDRDSASRS